ncbi:MAG: M28 family peptidase [Calditrichaeota bacterium]|nr:M28 family peptidase [Calditrichota bacterium]
MNVVLSIIIFLSGILYAGEPAEETEFIRSIYQTCLTKDITYSNLGLLCEKFPSRLTGSKGAAGAVKWTKKLLENYNYDRVFLQEFMGPHWERGEKEQAYFIISGERNDLSVLALGRSVSTPEAGITAKVLVVNSLDEVDSLGAENISGKIVFYNEPFAQSHIHTFSGYSESVTKRSKGPSHAARYGAVAVVIRSVGTAMDDHPHTGSLSYAEDAPQIPAAALGYQSADKLYDALQKDPDLKLTLKINSHTFPDEPSHNVIGEISGSEKRDQIILIGGHLDAWDTGQGAHDDGAGVMQSIGALRVLKMLGYIPKHTMRVVLFMNEENGLLGGKKYAEEELINRENHILAIESDAGGFVPRGFSFKGADSILMHLQSYLPYFPPYTIESIISGGGGADIGPLNKSCDTPLLGLVPDSQRYFDFHHSPADVFSAVNRRELELGTASLAAMIYLVDKYGL